CPYVVAQSWACAVYKSLIGTAYKAPNKAPGESVYRRIPVFYLTDLIGKLVGRANAGLVALGGCSSWREGNQHKLIDDHFNVSREGKTPALFHPCHQRRQGLLGHGLSKGAA